MATPHQPPQRVARETSLAFPTIPARSGTNPTSHYYPQTTALEELHFQKWRNLRTCVQEGDPFDMATSWQQVKFPELQHHEAPVDRAPALTYSKWSGSMPPCNRMLVLNVASEDIPGGKWAEDFLGLGAEESMARRSNLVQTLKAIDQRSRDIESYYPITPTGGIYSPDVVVFCSSHESYYRRLPRNEWTVISVVSVSPVRRPKLSEDGRRYFLNEEKLLQKEKMKTILRIAAQNGHINLVLGGFGSCGPGRGPQTEAEEEYMMINPDSGSALSTIRRSAEFESYTCSTYENPVADVAEMWNELLNQDPEFKGWFENVVFAVSSGRGAMAEFKKFFG